MNSHCDSTGRVGVCCERQVIGEMPPTMWSLGSGECPECGRRCYVYLGWDGPGAVPPDAQAVVALLGVEL